MYIYSDGLFDMVCQPRTFAKRSIYLWFVFFQFGTRFLRTWSFKNSKKKQKNLITSILTGLYELFHVTSGFGAPVFNNFSPYHRPVRSAAIGPQASW